MKNRHVVAGLAGLMMLIALLAYGLSPNEITSALQARGISDHGVANLYGDATAYRQFMVKTKDNGRLDISWFDITQLLNVLPKWGGNYYVDPSQPTPPGDTPPGHGAIFSPYQTMQAAAFYEADYTNGFTSFNMATGTHASSINIATSAKAGMANMKNIMLVGNGGAELTAAGSFTVNNGGCRLAFVNMKVSRTIAVSGAGTYYVYGYEGSTFLGLTATAPAVLNVILEPGCSYTGVPSLNGGTLTYTSPHPTNLGLGIQVWKDVITASGATDANTEFRTLRVTTDPLTSSITTNQELAITNPDGNYTQFDIVTGFLQNNIVHRSTDNHIQTNYIEDQGSDTGVTIDDSLNAGTLIKNGDITTYGGLTATSGSIHTVAASTAGDIYAMLGNIYATSGNIYATAGNIYATAGNVHTVAATPNGDIYAMLGNIYATGGNIYATAGNIHTVAASPNGDIYAAAGNIYATAGNIHTTGASGHIYATAGNIYATAGYLAAGTYVSAGTYMTATLGDITATNGNINANTLTNALQINGTDVLHHGAGGYTSNLFSGDGGNAISAASAVDNTATGIGALGLLTTGSGNVALGRYAGYRQTTESNHLFIDNQDRGVNEATLALVYGTFGAAVANQQLTVNGDLNVAGVTHPTGGLDLSRTIGDILYAPTANTVSGLADVAVDNALLSGGIGVAPGYGKVRLGTNSCVTGTLPIGNGGTGATSLTDTHIPYVSSTAFADSYMHQLVGLIGITAAAYGQDELGVTTYALDPARTATPTQTIWLSPDGVASNAKIKLVLPAGTAGGTYTLTITAPGSGLVSYNTPKQISHAGNYIPRANTTIANIEATGATIDDSDNISTTVLAAYQINANNVLWLGALGSGTNMFVGNGGANINNATALRNTAVGRAAMLALTSAYNNTAVGNNAGTSISTGLDNTVVGYNTAASLTNQSDNVAIGSSAMASANTSASQCVAIGSSALTVTKAGSVAVGYQAGMAQTTGNQNTYLGSLAGKSCSTASDNTYVGSSAASNATGGGNTALGRSAMYGGAANTGASNTAVGYASLYAITSANDNTAVGYLALASQTTADSNVAVGWESGYSITTGGYNVHVGAEAGLYVTTATATTLVGYCAGRYNSAGSNVALGFYALAGSEGSNGTGNVAVGTNAGLSITSGDYNTIIGLNAGDSITSGSENVAIGHSALDDLTTSLHNTAIGFQALRDTTNQSNVAVGYNAGYNNTTGVYNTYVGVEARADAVSYTNAMALGYGALVDAGNHVRIGDTNVTQIGGQVAWSNLSDARNKENVTDSTLGLDFILRLRAVKFNMIGGDGELLDGFLAQDVEAVCNDLGVTFSGLRKPVNPGSRYALQYGTFVVPLVNAVKELKAENDSLKSRLDAIELKLNNQ